MAIEKTVQVKGQTIDKNNVIRYAQEERLIDSDGKLFINPVRLIVDGNIVAVGERAEIEKKKKQHLDQQIELVSLKQHADAIREIYNAVIAQNSAVASSTPSLLTPEIEEKIVNPITGDLYRNPVRVKTYKTEQSKAEDGSTTENVVIVSSEVHDEATLSQFNGISPYNRQPFVTNAEGSIKTEKATDIEALVKQYGEEYNKKQAAETATMLNNEVPKTDAYRSSTPLPSQRDLGIEYDDADEYYFPVSYPVSYRYDDNLNYGSFGGGFFSPVPDYAQLQQQIFNLMLMNLLLQQSYVSNSISMSGKHSNIMSFMGLMMMSSFFNTPTSLSRNRIEDNSSISCSVTIISI